MSQSTNDPHLATRSWSVDILIGQRLLAAATDDIAGVAAGGGKATSDRVTQDA